MSKEYVIWGINNGENDETLLCEQFEGEFITELAKAQYVKRYLEKYLGSRDCWIQTITF